MSEPWSDDIAALRERLAGMIERADLGDDTQALAAEALEELAVVVEEMHAQYTELVVSRADLEQERARYHNLFETVPDGYVVTDSNGVMREVNATAADLFGKPRRGLIGKPLGMLVEPLDRRAFYAQLARLRNDGPGSHLSINLKVHDHLTVPANLRATVAANEDGSGPDIRWLIHDRRPELTQRDLRISEERLRALLDTAGVGFVLTDTNASIVFANQRADEILWRRQEDVIADEWLKWVHPDDATEVRAALDTACSDGLPTSLRHRIVGPTDELRWVDHGIAPHHTPSGAINGSVSTLADITETRHLRGLAERASRLESVGRLAAGIAHDFNNTLSTLQLRIDRLARRAGPEADADHDSAVATIERSKTIISDLLSFGGHQQAEPQPIDVNAEIQRTMSVLTELLGDKIAVEFILTPEDATGLINPGRFDQALTNLVLNARDAMPDGGTITIATEPVTYPSNPPLPTTDDPHLGPGTYIQLSVVDTGAGIDPTYLTQIFDPYFTTKPASRGTGLGLASTYGTIAHIGGAITVDSRPGAGARFTLWIPQTPSDSPKRPDRHAAVPPDSLPVLIVDDDPDIRHVLAQELERLGHNTLAAEHSEQALAHVDTPLHLLITDLQLPGIDGADLAATFSRHQPDIDILFVSGATQDRIRDRVPEGTPLLTKPFSADALAAALRAASRFEPQRGVGSVSDD